MPANINTGLEDYTKKKTERINNIGQKDNKRNIRMSHEYKKRKQNRKGHFLVWYDSETHRSCSIIYSVLII